MSIRLENINYIYSPDSAFRKQALKDVNLEIKDGQFIGLIGHTGSGKSTLIQHLNGLIRATSGTIYYNDQNIYDDKFKMKDLRAKVGLVFQYPEHQLFEVTVLKDVCFGPSNLGLSPQECEQRAVEALKLVGLKEKYWKKSPFELSGGQKRRAAIAGVLAMHPEVSHSMEDVAKYVERLIVMNGGSVMFDDTPKAVFKNYKALESIGLAAPQVTYLMDKLREKGMKVPENVTTVEEAKAAILAALDQRGGVLR